MYSLFIFSEALVCSLLPGHLKNLPDVDCGSDSYEAKLEILDTKMNLEGPSFPSLKLGLLIYETEEPCSITR